MDNKKATLLVMLDISAAYDTIDHRIFLNRLQSEFGIHGKALLWMKSYLEGRKNQVIIGQERSYVSTPECGSAQGSVMGGICYNMYSKPLGKVIKDSDVRKKAYADDNNMYVSFSIQSGDDRTSAVQRLERCLLDVKCWLKHNMLKLNDDKTKIIVFAPKRFVEKHQSTPRLV